MKLFYYRGAQPNFGDELNHWLWPKLLPDFFDDNACTAFMGIGSTLGEPPPEAIRKLVFGTGYAPGYHPVPNVHDGSWNIYCVRGPRTAARLNLGPELAVGDAGILVRTHIDTSQKTNELVTFIPHWESMGRGHWEAACRAAGVTLIDPRWSVEEVLALLLRSKMVIAEAMHGAIIADCLRIPFVPVAPLNAVHRDKWFDWAEALDFPLKPVGLWPSSLTELRGMRAPVRRAMRAMRVEPWVEAQLTELAAYRLSRLAQMDGQLSADHKLEAVTERLLEKLAQVKRHYGLRASLGNSA